LAKAGAFKGAYKIAARQLSGRRIKLIIKSTQAVAVHFGLAHTRNA
jgi:hypothetical protein